MLAAPKSGSGKTMITCALLKSLQNRGEQVIAYKCGPDYIDPMFHRAALGIPSKNLDTFFTNSETTKALFLKDRDEGEFAVVEGVMGLFDGLGGIREEGSSYHLAKVTKTPIVLVVDAKGMGRSVIALISGFLNYDTDKLVKGVILNRTSKAYFNLLKPLIVSELNIKVFGYFPEQKELHLASRHLGLVMPDEIEDIRLQLERASQLLEETVSIDDLVAVASQSESLLVNDIDGIISITDDLAVEEDGPVIAVAKDEAFCFYYKDNLSLIQTFGAKLIFFSPLHDQEIPKNCHGLLLGGGYPELYMEKLPHNESMKESIRNAINHHMPIVAECGGFMYLHKEITDSEGLTYKMVGAIQGRCIYTGKLVRFGYIELQEKTSNFLAEGEWMRGHEFHYFDSSLNGDDVIARKPVTGKEYDCIIDEKNCWLGFPHLYYPSNPAFAKVYVEKANQYKIMLERR